VRGGRLEPDCIPTANLLVDYESSQLTRFGPARQAVLGHGIYTLKDWLPSQLSLVLKWMEEDAR
jgi:hypothetical protein